MESAVSDRGVVAAPHYLAAETGRAILAEGGNAYEAMIAMAATIAVVYPHMNGIGGDGFWLVREPRGRKRFVDACGSAGSGATIVAYHRLGLNAVPLRGPFAACTVAGAVSGWSAALELAAIAGGKIPLAVLLSDAIRLAREGFPVSSAQAGIAIKQLPDVAAAPGFADRFLADGKPLALGTLLVQERLAATLEQLAHAGLDDFYRGDIGREMAGDLDRIGSPVNRADLERQRALPREPLALRLEEGTVYEAPLPTQGVAALLILGIAARLGLQRADDLRYVHGLVEATKRAYRIRDLIVTDPAHSRTDAHAVLTPERLEREAMEVNMTSAAPFPAEPGDGDTIWMGAIDKEGRAVSYIQSLFFEWGSGCVLPRTGVLWHNRGFSFSLDPDALNPLEPGRKPFHTLSPALAEFDDGRVMPFGTMGGDGQPQTLGAIYSRYAWFGHDIASAVSAPRWRLGKGWGEEETSLLIEPRFDSDVIDGLVRLGHPVQVTDTPFAGAMGHAGMIVRNASGRIEGVHDPRSDGGALAL